jgi:hypothetical protein
MIEEHELLEKQLEAHRENLEKVKNSINRLRGVSDKYVKNMNFLI